MRETCFNGSYLSVTNGNGSEIVSMDLTLAAFLLWGYNEKYLECIEGNSEYDLLASKKLGLEIPEARVTFEYAAQVALFGEGEDCTDLQDNIELYCGCPNAPNTGSFLCKDGSPLSNPVLQLVGEAAYAGAELQALQIDEDNELADEDRGLPK
jgi:hypothetical protein